jgi:hypothetical protein
VTFEERGSSPSVPEEPLWGEEAEDQSRSEVTVDPAAELERENRRTRVRYLGLANQSVVKDDSCKDEMRPLSRGDGKISRSVTAQLTVMTCRTVEHPTPSPTKHKPMNAVTKVCHVRKISSP